MLLENLLIKLVDGLSRDIEIFIYLIFIVFVFEYFIEGNFILILICLESIVLDGLFL